MKKLLKISTAAALLCFMAASGQQDPQYTQYMYNMNVINPAYAGTQEGLRATALYRQQWSGVEGAPETITFSGSSSVGERVGLGLSIISDQLGPVNEKNVYGDFAYRFPVGEKTNLSLGIKAGVTFHDVNLNFVTTTQPGDPLFDDQLNEQYLNVGAGAFLYGQNWYVGASVPNMIDAVHLEENDLNFGNETQHYFITSGYVFDLNEDFKLKPHFLVKGAFESPLSFDLNTNLLMYNVVEVGVSYRLDDSFSGILGLNVTDQFRVGYAYDRVISDIQIVADNSHEIFMSYDLRFPRKVMQSPRFF